MRLLNALGIGAGYGQPGRTVLLLAAVLIAPPVLAATVVAEQLTGPVQP